MIARGAKCGSYSIDFYSSEAALPYLGLDRQRAFSPRYLMDTARLFFAAFAPCLPSAVRVALGKCATVRFFFATAAAFLMFFLAAAFCAAVI